MPLGTLLTVLSASKGFFLVCTVNYKLMSARTGRCRAGPAGSDLWAWGEPPQDHLGLLGGGGTGSAVSAPGRYTRWVLGVLGLELAAENPVDDEA